MSFPVAVLLVTSATAQIVLDGSIGPSAGTLGGPNYIIGSEFGEVAGSNLFHSFSEFNLATGQSATFRGPATVDNILARVTGGPSSIRGAIRSEIPGANLFLINPAGIVFGPGASVNVSGAFHATTADFIGMADGSEFKVISGNGVVLTSAAPEAFGFLTGTGNAGGIRMDSNSTVVTGMNLAGRDVSFVGRRVELRNSFLKSAGGEISLTAVGAGEARVALAVPPVEAPLEQTLTGEVVVFNSALSVSGADGGEIIIRGGDVTVERAGAAVFQNGQQFEFISGIEADATGAAAGGSVRIEASNDILLSNNARVASFSRNNQDGGTLVFKAAGDVRLTTGADVVASSVVSGDGGVIDIRAANLVIDGTGATRVTRLSAQSNSTATGAGGSILVDVSGAVEIKAGGTIATNTLSSGHGGDIVIRGGSMYLSREGADVVETGILAKSLIPGSTASPAGYGDAGNITVDIAGPLVINDGATIQSTSSSDGQAGTIRVNAGSLSITGVTDGFRRGNFFLTGIVGLTTLPDPQAGRGGELFVNVAGDMNLAAGGLIDSSSFGRGQGGNVSVIANRIIADRAGSEFFTGIGSDTELNVAGTTGPVAWDAGNVTVEADFISLANGALISSSTAGNGKAGNVTVETGTLHASGFGNATSFVFSTGSGVVAGTRGAVNGKAASTGDGGTVRVHAREEILVSGQGEIAARANGLGAGGMVEVLVPDGRLVLEDGGQVSSSSDLTGNAGVIVLRGDSLVFRRGGLIESANTGTGNAGGVVGTFGDIQSDGGVISVSAVEKDAGTLQLLGAAGITLSDMSLRANAGNNGGNIEITSSGLVLVRDSRISADAGGSGGNIILSNASHLVLNDTPVSASAVERDGGNILVSTGTFFANNSLLSVTSEQGAPGTINIETLNTLAGGEETEDPTLLDPNDVLQPACVDRAPDVGSSFTKAGRGGTKRLPGGYLPSFRLIE